MTIWSKGWARLLSGRLQEVLSWATFLGASLLFLYFQKIHFFNAGGTWRDEASSISAAAMPSLSGVVANFPLTGAPALFSVILHLWMRVGSSTSDEWLRVLSLVISLGFIASLVWWGWMSSRRPPLLALALLAFNPQIFFWAGSIRAYGLAMIFIVLLFGLILRIVQEPSVRRGVPAAVVAILAVQSSFQNSYLVMALCAAAVIASVVGKRWRGAALAVAVGVAAGLSLVPYAVVLFRQGDWVRTLWFPFAAIPVAETMWGTLRSAGGSGACAWFLLVFGSVAVSGWSCWRLRKNEEDRTRLLTSLYVALAVVLSVLAFVAFVRLVGIWTQVWHFIPLMAVLAMAVDTMFDARDNGSRAWVGGIVVAILLILTSLPSMWTAALTRYTNIDMVAAKVMRYVRPNDFIVVWPFYCGVSFNRYYAGETPWATVPPIPSGDVAFYNKAIRQHMNAPREALRPLLEKMTETLQSGGRLWLVGGIPPMLPSGDPPDLVPAPHPVYGWMEGWYEFSWSLHVSKFVREHALRGSFIDVPVAQPVNMHESLPLLLVEGWKE